MGGDCFDDLLNPVHDQREIHLILIFFQPETVMLVQLMDQFCTGNQGFAWHTALIEAFPSHQVFFNQGNPCFYCGCNITRHQPCSSCTDRDQIVIITGHIAFRVKYGFRKKDLNLLTAGLDPPHQAFHDQGENSQQNEGADQHRGKDVSCRLDLS